MGSPSAVGTDNKTAGDVAARTGNKDTQGGFDAALRSQSNGSSSNKAPEAKGQLPTTSTVISSDTPKAFTNESAIKNAYETFAKQQGLSKNNARDYAERAYALTDGSIRHASDNPDQDGQPLTDKELAQQRAAGKLEFSPTRAQLGLLHAMSAQQPSIDPSSLGALGASGIGLAFPRAANVVPGNHTTSTGVAVKILENIADGRPPFRPDLGQHGPTQWFVTEGKPYVGRPVADSTTIPVDIKNPTGAPVVEFNERQLLETFQAEYPDAVKLAEEQLRQREGISADRPLNSKQRGRVQWNANNIAQNKMWTRVGQMVADSDSGLGRVNLVNSQFSRTGDGQFMLTSRADAAQVRGGASTMIDIIKKTGEPADNAVLEAAEKLATQEKWTGKVQGVYKWGGRALIIVGAAADGYRLYTADDKWRESAEVVGGWGGATAGSAAWSKVASPLLAGGPWGWAAYGGGMLVSGGVGYLIGEKVGEEVYELAVDGDPILIGPRD